MSPAAPSREDFWDPEIQTMPRERLAELQSGRLVEDLARAAETIPFFQRLWGRAAFDPGSVSSVEEIGKLPIYTKDDLRASEAENPPIGDYRAYGLGECVRLATSTGTTGRPTFAIWTAHDLETEYELACRLHFRAGQRPGMVVVNAHPGYLNGGQSLAAGAAEHMGCLSVSIGPPMTDELAEDALRRLEGLEVDRWMVMPAAVHRLRAAAERMGWTGSLPDPSQGGASAQLDIFGAGQETYGHLGSACAPGRGCHVCEDRIVLEVLDPKTLEPVPDGERGVMVLTTLGRDNPMLRYNLEDVIRTSAEPCVCGETHRRAWYDGRLKDVVEVDGKTILPVDVWNVLPDEAEFALVRRPGAGRLEVRLEGAADEELRAAIEAAVGVEVELREVEAGSLARTGYKLTRVIDEGEA